MSTKLISGLALKNLLRKCIPGSSHAITAMYISVSTPADDGCGRNLRGQIRGLQWKNVRIPEII